MGIEDYLLKKFEWLGITFFKSWKTRIKEKGAFDVDFRRFIENMEGLWDKKNGRIKDGVRGLFEIRKDRFQGELSKRSKHIHPNARRISSETIRQVEKDYNKGKGKIDIEYIESQYTVVMWWMYWGYLSDVKPKYFGSGPVQ